MTVNRRKQLESVAGKTGIAVFAMLAAAVVAGQTHLPDSALAQNRATVHQQTQKPDSLAVVPAVVDALLRAPVSIQIDVANQQISIRRDGNE